MTSTSLLIRPTIEPFAWATPILLIAEVIKAAVEGHDAYTQVVNLSLSKSAKVSGEVLALCRRSESPCRVIR